VQEASLSGAGISVVSATGGGGRGPGAQ
jgi:hypothetical protein